MTVPTLGRAPVASPVWLRTRSALETRRLAASLAAAARPGDRIALVGPLGVGKTEFAKGFAEGLGVTDVVNSPSFTLMAEYAGRLPLFHQDLYRLADTAEAIAGGLLDERQDAGVTVSEWADRLDESLDVDRLTVRMMPIDDETRLLEISAGGDLARRYLGVAQRWHGRPGDRESDLEARP